MDIVWILQRFLVFRVVLYFLPMTQEFCGGIKFSIFYFLKKYGQLGLGDIPEIKTITLNPFLNNIIEISNGREFSAVLDSYGNIFTFGYGIEGQLCLNSSNNMLFPTLINNTQAKSISLGAHYLLFVNKNDSQVYGCGSNYYGELGLGEQLFTLIPTQITFGSNISFIKGVKATFIYQNYNCFGLPGNSPSACNNGSCVTPNQCLCYNRYSGVHCQNFTCFGVSPNDPTVCGGNGKCIGGDFCQCNYGYSGNKCQDFTCYGLVSTDIKVCKSHGRCVSIDDCVCYQEYSGPECQFYECYGKNISNSSVCSGRGLCLDNLFQCACNNGYSGRECEFSDCFGINSSSSNVCSSRGACIGYDQCKCQSPYTGNQCSEFYCNGLLRTDPNVCSSQGTCSKPDFCSCNPRYIGNNCSLDIVLIIVLISLVALIIIILIVLLFGFFCVGTSYVFCKMYFNLNQQIIQFEKLKESLKTPESRQTENLITPESKKTEDLIKHVGLNQVKVDEVNDLYQL